MSYVLHIWEQPAGQPWPSSIEEANSALTSLSRKTTGQNPKFLALATRLTARYPCICSPEAEEMPESEWAWSDGPLDGKTEHAKYSIGLNTDMLKKARQFVFDQALQLELNIMDEQAGQVLLANGRLLF